MKSFSVPKKDRFSWYTSIMKKYLLVFTLLISLFAAPVAFAATTTKKTATPVKTVTRPLESMFYYIPGAASFASMQMYADKITILAPQAYTVDDTGTLKGKLSDQVTKLVAAKNIKVMPLIANQNFSQTTIHTILSSIDLQNKVIDQLVAEAKAKNYIGWEFDFERISATDRDAYSSFVELAASKFKSNGLRFSVAVLARTSENPGDLPAGSWDNWSGVYDYKRIGKAADFVTLMAYDMPDSTGPVASMDWIKKTLAYVKKSIPANKISLGIPTYGWQWDTDDKVKLKAVSWEKVNELVVNKLYNKMGFDSKIGEGWITYSEKLDFVTINYKIWFENAKSFKQKYDYAKAQKLYGISVWALGLEDDGLWVNFKKIH